jgi:prepilin peptidase CpaA
VTAASLLLLGLAGAAGAWDLARGRIPNGVTYAGALAGLVAAGVESGVPGVARSALGLGAGLAGGLPLFLVGGMGGGDVKLLAAVGALAGPLGLLHVALAALLVGAGAAVVWLAWRGELRRSLWSVAVFFATACTPRANVVLPRGGPRLRFGVCVALAAAALACAGPP